MKRRKYLVPVLIVIVLMAILIKSQFPKLYIATGYGAKAMATAVFFSGREPQLVQTIDLNYSIVKYTRSKIDFKNKSVTTSFWGLAKQTAVFREGLGCCLIGSTPADLIQKFSFTPPLQKRAGLWRIPWPNGDQIKDTIFLSQAVTFFQIAIAISAISILTKKKSLWIGSILISLAGMGFFIWGFV